MTSATQDDRVTTRSDLTELFNSVGLRPGMHVMVHASLSQFGFLVNGAHDVLDALFDVLGPEGTVLASSNTGQLTDPEQWSNPAVSSEFVEVIRENMRPFDRKTTPIWNRGILPNALMMYDDVKRSDHPLRSVIARGGLAEFLTESHPLHQPEGPGSPLFKLYESGGHTLMLGTTLRHCSALHVAEFIADVPYLRDNQCRVLVEDESGVRHFVRIRQLSEAHYFSKIEPIVSERGLAGTVRYGFADVSLIGLRPLVEAAVAELANNERLFLLP